MIKLENINKQFEEKTIFSEFNKDFKSGKSYALTGKSGSGKTTLLNIIGKLEVVDSGEIKINNQSLSKIKEKSYFRDYVGYLFQNYGLIDNESIAQNLDLAFVGRKTSAKEKRKKISEALSQVKLQDIDVNRKIYSLSGGEAQRVAIAKLVIKDPPIILADEPTASLDEENSRDVINLILDLLTADKTIIIATHNPNVWQHMDEIVEVDR